MTTLYKQIKVKTFLPGRSNGRTVDCGSHLLPIQRVKAQRNQGCFSQWIVLDDTTTEDFVLVGNRGYRIESGETIYIHQTDVNLLPKNNPNAAYILREFASKLSELLESFEKAKEELDNGDQ